MPAAKSRATILGPIRSSMRLPAKPVESAWNTLPVSTFCAAAKRMASAIPSILTTWAIWLHSLATWPAP
ncbi:hypothetical protein D3C86_1818420 [compost metagenome]